MLLNQPFGDYILVRKIATGGMAEVYLALKRGPGLFDRLVALKTILSHHLDNETILQMFYNEARLGARFNHPNLIPVLGVTLVQETPTMEMEYVAGATVADLVRRARDLQVEVRRPVGIRIVLDACLGLYDAHHLRDVDGSALSVVHRDVSPQNILVGHSGQVKVFDFGIAHTTGTADDSGNLAGVLAGKYAYMSPEQCHGGELDERSDVFSLGILLYELTTHKRLFRRRNQIEVLRAITEEPVTPPSEAVKAYPRGLEGVIMAALERDPDNRPSSALELHNALLKYAALADEQMTSSELGAFMEELYADEIEAEREMIRQAVEYAHRTALSKSMRGWSTRAEKSKASESEGELELEALAARSVPDPSGPRVTVTGSLEPTGVDRALSHKLDRARRLNGALVMALMLVIGVGVAAYVVLTDSATADTAAAAARRVEPRLIVESAPPGATLFIDGIQRAEATPATLPLPLDSRVDVRLELPDHQTATSQVTLTREAPVQRLNVTLVPERPTTDDSGVVRVVTVPPDTMVAIDGVVRGTGTPILVESLTLGAPHTLRVEADGYEPRAFDFQLLSGATREIRLELDRSVDLGTLSVRTQPIGARVLIDGEAAGLTPLEQLPLVAGREFALSIELDGYRTYHTTVRLDPNQEAVVNQNLSRPRRTGRPADGMASAADGEVPSEAGASSTVTPVEAAPEHGEEDEPRYELVP